MKKMSFILDKSLTKQFSECNLSNVEGGSWFSAVASGYPPTQFQRTTVYKQPGEET
jgi:hypothetical protein